MEFFDCYGNSTRDVTGTPSTTVTTTVTPPVTIQKVTEAKPQLEIEDKESTPEVVAVSVKADIDSSSGKISESKNNEEAKEKELNGNEINDGPMNDHPTGSSISDANPPPTDQSGLVKAGARGPLGTESDGLLIMFICVVAGVIALAVLIMIPILILRKLIFKIERSYLLIQLISGHKSRSNRMYLNKNLHNQSLNGNGNTGTTNGTNGHNGAALNGDQTNGPEEQVQLMNSYQLH